MKFMSRFLNLIIALTFCIVMGIFSFGYFNKKEIKNDSTPFQTDQSSLKDSDALSNKYMQELQNKLRNQQIESINLIHKAPMATKLNERKLPVKDEDFTQNSLEEQIKPHESREVSVYNEKNKFSDFAITKENAQEFIETAKRSGYHVILSENFEILSMTPIIKNKKLNLNDSFEVTDPQ